MGKLKVGLVGLGQVSEMRLHGYKDVEEIEVGRLERFYGVYGQKRHQFKSIDECANWHNEVRPHLSLNIETPEILIQVFQRKRLLEKTETIQTT